MSGRGNFQSEKCPVGEIATQGNVWSGKCPVGEMSSRGNSRSGKCQVREVSSRDVSVGEVSVVEMSSRRSVRTSRKQTFCYSDFISCFSSYISFMKNAFIATTLAVKSSILYLRRLGVFVFLSLGVSPDIPTV